MKALIRSPNETVRESDGILGIDWTTGAPLTNAAWCGGSYTLVLDWKEEPNVEDAGTESPSACNDEVVASAPSDTEPDDDEICTRIAEPAPEKVYVINGRQFTESELKNLLIAE